MTTFTRIGRGAPGLSTGILDLRAAGMRVCPASFCRKFFSRDNRAASTGLAGPADDDNSSRLRYPNQPPGSIPSMTCFRFEFPFSARSGIPRQSLEAQHAGLDQEPAVFGDNIRGQESITDN